MEMIKNLSEKNKRLIIEQEEIEKIINSLKSKQIEQVPHEIRNIIEEPFILKKVSVQLHMEFIKFPVMFI